MAQSRGAAPTSSLALLVERDAPGEGKIKFEAERIGDLKENEVILSIDKAGLSTNNITYVVMGRVMQYFDFFPVENHPDLGKVPIWGLATVVRSKNSQIKQGEKVFGYFPLAQYIKVLPTNITAASFYVDRPQLPADRAVYNTYTRVANDHYYPLSISDEVHIIYAPLFWTSYFLADYISENAVFGADTVVVSSASSKTAYCFAYLATRNSNLRVVGLTSPGNKKFVKDLGVYTEVVTYDDIGAALGPQKTRQFLYVDISGSRQLKASLESTLGQRLSKIVTVGMTTWGETAVTDLPPSVAAKSEFFFAPSWIQKRLAEVTPEDMTRSRQAAWKQLQENVSKWIEITTSKGKEATADIYTQLLAGKFPAKAGYIVSLHDSKQGPIALSSSL